MKNTWDEAVTYRLSFSVWRFRNVLQLLTMYFLWYALVPAQKTTFGYSQSLILTYILGTSILSSLILSSRSYDLGDSINKGDLSSYLMRPINFFYYLFAKDIGDKAMNITFSVGELTILFILLRPPFFIQTNPFYLTAFFMSIIAALILFFFCNLLLGFIGFWSPETWAPRFIFGIFINFFAGGLFPLDILPAPLFAVFRLSPLTYLLYFPLKLYLGQLSFPDMLSGFLISYIWIFCMYKIIQLVWMRGLKVYTAQGM